MHHPKCTQCTGNVSNHSNKMFRAYAHTNALHTHCNTNTNALRYHIRTKHTGEKLHKCPECDEAFVQKCDLNTHLMKVHTGERPFPCSECDKVFVIKISLDYHMKKVHTGERYTCGTCNKCFVTESNLKHHNIRVHTGERPFQCRQCNLGFILNCELQRHIRKSTTDKVVTIVLRVIKYSILTLIYKLTLQTARIFQDRLYVIAVANHLRHTLAFWCTTGYTQERNHINVACVTRDSEE